MAIVGAGITGLATAYLLGRARPAWHVEVYEAAEHIGGKARTTVRDGYTVDWGPNGFLTTVPETLELARQVGLEDELQPASEAARHRFLYRDGGLRPLPTRPPAFLASEVVPLGGRLRAALELALGGRHDGEESVHAFLARHFGHGFADALADVFVSGITAGDPRELSLDALFPRLRAMERAHGSLVRALIAQQGAARRARRAAGGPAAEEATAIPPGRLTSFRQGGMQRLLETLADALPRPVRLGAPVIRLERAGAGYRATVSGDAAGDTAGNTAEAFDAVVVTVPAPAAADLLRPLAPVAADALAAIPYAGVRVFGLGFDRIDVPRALDGFGFLVPRGQGVRSLGVLWTSTLYPGRAPAGKVLLRVLAGGRLDPGMLELPADAALEAVRRDLRISMGIVVEPEFVETVRWPEAIPQYTLGHGARLAAVDEALAGLPGLHLAGNAYRGVGVNDCVREARRVVEVLARGTDA